MPHTESELTDEWLYIFCERLGILCGVDKPTDAQQEMARKEADEVVETLSQNTP